MPLRTNLCAQLLPDCRVLSDRAPRGRKTVGFQSWISSAHLLRLILDGPHRPACYTVWEAECGASAERDPPGGLGRLFGPEDGDVLLVGAIFHGSGGGGHPSLPRQMLYAALER